MCVFALFGNAQRYYGVESPDYAYSGFIVFDLGTLTVLDSVDISYDNGTIDGFNGLAHNPVDNKLYTVLKNTSGARELAEIDTLGNATFIGSLGNTISAITFGPDGTLYGISGSGGSGPYERMYTINITNADTTFFFDPPSSNEDGEALAYDYTNDLIYRYQGYGIIQRINPSTFEVDTVKDDGVYENWSQVLFYDQNNDNFSFFDGYLVYTMTPEGAVTLIDTLPDNIAFKGVVDVSVFNNVGIKENNFAETIRLYPNPSDGIFTVNTGVKNTEITVSDINGRIIYRTNGNKINIADQAAGVYFLRVKTDNSVISKKFIKK